MPGCKRHHHAVTSPRELSATRRYFIRSKVFWVHGEKLSVNRYPLNGESRDRSMPELATAVDSVLRSKQPRIERANVKLVHAFT
jgi:hypothetical protein